MTQDSIYSNGRYATLNPSWHVEDSEWKANSILHFLRANRLHPKSVCEIGCGAGQILIHLEKQLKDNIVFYGYEISPQAYEICSQTKHHNIRFYLKDLLEEDDVFYDLIMAIDVLEHVEDYIGFLKAFGKFGNYKLFHIPLELSAQTVFREFPLLKVRHSVGHLHYFTKNTALATLKYAGYEIIDFAYTSGAIDLPSRNLKSLLLKFPRKFLFSLCPDLTAKLLGGFSLLVLAK